MDTAQKRMQNEHPILGLISTKKALFCPFMYFKVPKRTKTGSLTPALSRRREFFGVSGFSFDRLGNPAGGRHHTENLNGIEFKDSGSSRENFPITQ